MKALKANSLQLDDWITLKNEENYLGKILLNKGNKGTREQGGSPSPLSQKKKYGLKFNPELAQEGSWLALIGLQTGPSCSKDG